MKTLLAARDVRVEFGPLVAVRDVSFDLEGGTLLGLVGPNGAGKTTLLRVLAGLHAPTRGRAEIMGRPVLGKDERARHHLGFAPDAPPAYESLTLERFLRFIGLAYGLARAEAQERIDFWLEQLWLTDKRDALIKDLSRGMRQRVTLARTFIPKPHVLLLDEPLSGIDPGGRIQLRRVLSMLREQGCAMIVSSHILTDLEDVATHIAIIERGSILRWSQVDALYTSAGTQRTYRLTTVDAGHDYHHVITGQHGITHVDRDGANVYTFAYDADDVAAAGLLRRLVDAGVPVASFGPVRESLEAAYLRAGLRQID
ncbi:MAG: ABC transporter ATP-binding protein [Phycisphaerae bacterium]